MYWCVFSIIYCQIRFVYIFIVYVAISLLYKYRFIAKGNELSVYCQ